jgi:16S rRNA (cytidine1402-2'-O)-methyltransferase
MLYIVGTPIGNLDDLSIRQAKTLSSSDIILAEDTRSAHILLLRIPQLFPNIPNHPNPPKLISYYKDVEFQKLPVVIDLLKKGKTISLISESGMPLISDPGYLLVKTCIKEQIPYTVIPGPSAVTTSLLCSGFNPKEFMFLGFFPKKKSELYQLINRLKEIKKVFPEMVFIFYESPNRIHSTLQCIVTLEWDVEIVICRELTKKFEEIIRGKPADLLDRHYKGELTVVIR